MMHWMRKHRKWILWGIVIIVVPTFVVWGGYARASRGRNRDGEGPAATVVASVGGIPIMREDFQERLNQEIRRREQYGQTVAMEDLAADGTAERILDGLIDNALISQEVAKLDLTLSRDFLVERLKDDSSFKDEQGKFNPTLWNDWVTADRRQNWNAIYDSVAQQVAREMLIKQVIAPARVLDDEVRKEFEKSRTQFQVKFITVEPKIVATPEQIQKQYDQDPTKYQVPERRHVQHVAFSLAPSRPAELDEIVSKARSGEDFAALAGQYSAAPQAKENGGEIGWFTEENTRAEHMKVTLGMKPGDVSDPVENNGAYYIFKVDQEKPDEMTGKPSKLLRQIMLRPSLSEEERQAVQSKAEAFAAKVAESGDFNAAAGELGLTVQTAPGLSSETTEIDSMPTEDVRSFVAGIETVAAGETSPVVESIRNLYVVKVLEVEPPVIRPFEEVKDKAEADAVEAIRASPEHAERVRELTAQIKAQASTLQQAVELFPDLALEIKETKPFAERDYLFTQGIFVQSGEVINAVQDLAPGTLAGPLRGFRAEAYFFELVSKTPPTEDMLTNEFPKEEEKLRKTLLTTRQNQLLMEYVAALRERAATETPISRDIDAISDVLGLNRPAAEGEGEGEGEPAAVADAPAEAAPTPAPEAAAPEAAAPAPEAVPAPQ